MEIMHLVAATCNFCVYGIRVPKNGAVVDFLSIKNAFLTAAHCDPFDGEVAVIGQYQDFYPNNGQNADIREIYFAISPSNDDSSFWFWQTVPYGFMLR